MAEWWKLWERGNPNTSGRGAPSNPLSVDNLLEDPSPLPVGTDKRELTVYAQKRFTGNAITDAELRQLVKSYNDIAKLRRTYIRKTSQKNCRNHYDAASELKVIKDMSVKAKTSFENLWRRNAHPLSFPQIFNSPPGAPIEN